MRCSSERCSGNRTLPCRARTWSPTTKANPRKKYRTVTNYRGEYRIRVPAGDASYVLSASAPRFAEVRRTVQVYGIEKTTANLILEPRKQARNSNRRKAGH